MSDVGSEPASSRYLAKAREALTRLEGQLDRIETAARWAAETIAAGGLLYLAGTGHSRMIAEETYHRAGGLVAIRPVFDPALSLAYGPAKATEVERLHDYGRIVIEASGLTAADLLFVISNSGRNAVPIDMALTGTSLGCRVVAITSLAHSRSVTSRHAGGKRLFEVADLVIDTCVEHGDASLTVHGLRPKVGPLSTIAGVAIVNAIMARAAELLIAGGHAPQVLVSDNAAENRTGAPRVDG